MTTKNGGGRDEQQRVAWEVHRLCLRPEVLARFRDQVAAWLRALADHREDDAPAWKPGRIATDKARAKHYFDLAQLHDALCPPANSIDPFTRIFDPATWADGDDLASYWDMEEIAAEQARRRADAEQRLGIALEAVTLDLPRAEGDRQAVSKNGGAGGGAKQDGTPETGGQWNAIAHPKKEWTELLRAAHRCVRTKPSDFEPAGRWLDTEYSESAIRERYEQRDAGPGGRMSPYQIIPPEKGKDARLARLSSALVDLRHAPPDLSSFAAEDPRVWARRVVLLVCLLTDRDASEYMAGLTDLGGLPWWEDEGLGRAWAHGDDLKRGDEPWATMVREALRPLPSTVEGERDYRAMIDARRSELEARLLASPSFRAAVDGSARWETARAAAAAEHERWQSKIEAFKADHRGAWEPGGPESEDYRLLCEGAWEAYLGVLAEHGFRRCADDGATVIVNRSEFHRTTDLRATSDGLWQKLDTFRSRLLRGGEYSPGDWLSLAFDIRLLAHAAGLRPNLGTVEWVIASVPELRAGCPGMWDDGPDDGWHVLFTAAGECGWSEMHNLLDRFKDRAKRELAIEWAESWMNARERQLVGTAPALALGGVVGGAASATAAHPTMSDLAAEVGISDDTFRRVRRAANIEVKEKGAAARKRRYPPGEVDRLIAAAITGNYLERAAMAAKWARFGTQVSRK